MGVLERALMHEATTIGNYKENNNNHNVSIAKKYTNLLKQCNSLDEVKFLHSEITQKNLQHDRFVCNYLVEMYAKHGNLDSSIRVFESIQDKNVYSYTIMIVACVQNKRGKLCISLLHRMDLEGVKLDEMTYSSLVGAFTNLTSLQCFHKRITHGGYETNPVIAAALINMYTTYGSLECARESYKRTPIRDVVLMTSMLSAFAEFGDFRRAVNQFREMDLEGIKPNELTYNAVLISTRGSDEQQGNECLQFGKYIHTRIKACGLAWNHILANGVVTMYARCGCITEAEIVFKNAVMKATNSWNAMLVAYVQNQQMQRALELHRRMDLEGVLSDQFTYVIVLDVCASCGTLELGKTIHERVRYAGYMDAYVATALLDMYGKRGFLKNARNVFLLHGFHCEHSWTAMIAAYARNGHSQEALELYGRMDHQGLRPNNVTFVNVLFACSHYGLVKKACMYFQSMIGDYGIHPEAAHYGCMVDMFSRVGQLERAQELINIFPRDLQEFMYSPELSLLGGCRLHGDVKRGEKISHEVDSMCREKYVMLFNLYVN